MLASDDEGAAADALAVRDAEQTPGGALAGDDASFTRSAAGGDEAYEARLREQQPSSWGRFDVGLSLRRRANAPAHGAAYQTGELWLVATWRN